MSQIQLTEQQKLAKTRWEAFFRDKSWKLWKCGEESVFALGKPGTDDPRQFDGFCVVLRPALVGVAFSPDEAPRSVLLKLSSVKREMIARGITGANPDGGEIPILYRANTSFAA